MAWRWTYEDAEGAELASDELPATEFPTQSDAESWLGETWRELRPAGVDRVTLREDDRVVYRGLSLRV